MVSQSGDPEPVADPFGELSSANPAVGMRTDSNANRVAQDFLHLTNPDNGTDVVFTPGEALPGWARELQAQRMDMPNLEDEMLYGSRYDAVQAPKRAIRTQVKPPLSGTDKTE
ncbi:hypothetical protein C9424_10805 [Arthrobacter sp. H-02-3]|nr:hypothetical protein C9424_10805 [Arthrobacter sp. H-02-3]